MTQVGIRKYLFNDNPQLGKSPKNKLTSLGSSPHYTRKPEEVQQRAPLFLNVTTEE